MRRRRDHRCRRRERNRSVPSNQAHYHDFRHRPAGSRWLRTLTPHTGRGAANRKKNARRRADCLRAFARIEDRVKALAAGYQMHVAKPVEPGELLTIVASLSGLMDHRNAISEEISGEADDYVSSCAAWNHL